jgi:hypothetical protein
MKELLRGSEYNKPVRLQCCRAPVRNFYLPYSGDRVKEDETGEFEGRIGDTSNAYTAVIGNPESKRILKP